MDHNDQVVQTTVRPQTPHPEHSSACSSQSSTWHSLLQYHLLEQPAQTNSDFFCPQPWHSGVFFFPSSFFPLSLSFSTLGLAAALCKFLLALSSTEENLVSTSPLLPLLVATLGLLGE